MTHFSFRTGAKTNPFRSFNVADMYILGILGTGISKRSICTESQREKTIESKGEIDERESNTGLPKFGDEYGNGGSILDNSRMQAVVKVSQSRISNVSLSESTSMEAGNKNTLEELFNLLKAGKISEYKLMTNPLLYKIAYHKIKSKPGNLTPGADEITLDGISKG